MTINELRAKRNQAWEAAKAFVETKRDKDGLLSEEDAKTYAQMEKKVQDYGAEIERMEAMSAMDAQLSKPTSTPITEKPMNGTSVNDQKSKTGRASDAYKDGMLKALRTNFRQVSNVLQEGIDADGGYLVPEEYDSRLIEALEEENIFRKLGHTITTSGERKINIAATKPANGVVVSTSEDGGDPVAVGFRAKKSNGKYKYYWLYRVKFGIPATNLATKGDSITFSTPTIEGTILRRNKVDGNGKHPWKAEVTEGDSAVTADTITNWYKEVYEPSYTTAAAE